MNLAQLLFDFFKMGLVGFGGGSAFIPIVRNEVVVNRRALSDDEYVKHCVVVNITPGTLPVKLGATCGLHLAGPLGAFAASYAVLLPGTAITVSLVALFAEFGRDSMRYLHYAGFGIGIFIVFLLANFIKKTLAAGNRRANILVCVLAFILTGGKTVREILENLLALPRHSLGTSLFNLPMIHIMVLVFSCILYFQASGRGPRAIPGVILTLLYIVLSGGAAKSWAYASMARWIVMFLFAAFILILRRPGNAGGKEMRLLPRRDVLWSVGLFLLTPLLPVAWGFATGAFPSPIETGGFLANILFSAITSFGGGEAYVAVADSIFVQGHYVAAEVFYGQILPVANTLPGPILVKMAAAIGFSWGQTGGTMERGVLLAAASTMLATGACCALAVLALNFYEALKHSAFVTSLKRYILPVICGTLISTSLGMMYESMKIAGEYGFSGGPVLAAMIAGVAFTFWINVRLHTHEILYMAFWIAVSMALIPLSQ